MKSCKNSNKKLRQLQFILTDADGNEYHTAACGSIRNCHTVALKSLQPVDVGLLFLFQLPVTELLSRLVILWQFIVLTVLPELFTIL